MKYITQKSALFLAGSLLGACATHRGAGGAAYDTPALGPIKGAVVHDSILPGEPVSGEALSRVPMTHPASASPVHEVRIDISNKVIEVAEGVKFSSWTFGGDLPGPVIRIKQGDLLKFTMANRTAETLSAAIGLPMPHSIDFHSALVGPQDKYRSIAPGQTLQYEFVGLYPGVYMYHCGTPMILEHLVAGMYGMMIVEPKEGYPTKVDREYVIVQSELYLKKGPAKGMWSHDIEAAKKKNASYVVFNGVFQRHVNAPLIARAGERVRLFVLNAGPSGTSSFHVVGTIFDRVWLEGNPFNELRGSQTVLLGASNSAIVEFLIPEAAKYIMVDHEFADATAGALGLIDATGGKTGGE